VAVCPPWPRPKLLEPTDAFQELAPGVDVDTPVTVQLAPDGMVAIENPTASSIYSVPVLLFMI